MNPEQVPKKTYTYCKKRYYQKTKEIRCEKAKAYSQEHKEELKEKRKVRYHDKRRLNIVERELQAMYTAVGLHPPETTQ